MNEKCISGRDEILGFFREKNIVYLKRSRIEWKPLLRKNFYKSPYYKANKPEFLELDKRYGSEIDQCRIAPVDIRRISDSIGYGLFAAGNLQKGEFIGEYTGVIRISDEQTQVFLLNTLYQKQQEKKTSSFFKNVKTSISKNIF